jgi:hypothetical protein
MQTPDWDEVTAQRLLDIVRGQHPTHKGRLLEFVTAIVDEKPTDDLTLSEIRVSLRELFAFYARRRRAFWTLDTQAECVAFVCWAFPRLESSLQRELAKLRAAKARSDEGYLIRQLFTHPYKAVAKTLHDSWLRQLGSKPTRHKDGARYIRAIIRDEGMTVRQCGPDLWGRRNLTILAWKEKRNSMSQGEVIEYARTVLSGCALPRTSRRGRRSDQAADYQGEQFEPRSARQNPQD